MSKTGYVYMMMNKTNSVIYTGVTSDLQQRVYQHKEKVIAGFTKKYQLTKLVYYEMCEDIISAISREKQIKAWSRIKKLNLIKEMNLEFKDLYYDL